MARRGSASIIGLIQLERAIQRIGEVPKKVVTKAARAGAKIAYRATKGNAPHDTYALKNAIVMRVERQKKVGKRVFDIKVDPKKNSIFVKVSGAGKRSYYPASQEYGFLTVNGKLVPGKRYFRRSLDQNRSAIEDAIIDVGIKEIDKAWEAR